MGSWEELKKGKGIEETYNYTLIKMSNIEAKRVEE